MDLRLVLSDDLYAYLTLTLIYVNHICIIVTVKLCHILKGHCFAVQHMTKTEKGRCFVYFISIKNLKKMV